MPLLQRINWDSQGIFIPEQIKTKAGSYLPAFVFLAQWPVDNEQVEFP